MHTNHKLICCSYNDDLQMGQLDKTDNHWPRKYKVTFDFHQTGSNFVIGNKHYKIKHHDEYSQAKKGMKYLEKIQRPSK